MLQKLAKCWKIEAEPSRQQTLIRLRSTFEQPNGKESNNVALDKSHDKSKSFSYIKEGLVVQNHKKYPSVVAKQKLHHDLNFARYI